LPNRKQILPLKNASSLNSELKRKKIAAAAFNALLGHERRRGQQAQAYRRLLCPVCDRNCTATQHNVMGQSRHSLLRKKKDRQRDAAVLQCRK
jgi:hypothetical protein